MTSNCPNCGAPWEKAAICAYCGTQNPDVCKVIAGKPIRISYEVDGMEYSFTVLMDRLSMEQNYDWTDIRDFAGDRVFSVTGRSWTDVTMEGRLVADSDGVYLREVCK